MLYHLRSRGVLKYKVGCKQCLELCERQVEESTVVDNTLEHFFDQIRMYIIEHHLNLKERRRALAESMHERDEAMISKESELATDGATHMSPDME